MTYNDVFCETMFRNKLDQLLNHLLFGQREETVKDGVERQTEIVTMAKLSEILSPGHLLALKGELEWIGKEFVEDEEESLTIQLLSYDEDPDTKPKTLLIGVLHGIHNIPGYDPAILKSIVERGFNRAVNEGLHRFAILIDDRGDAQFVYTPQKKVIVHKPLTIKESFAQLILHNELAKSILLHEVESLISNVFSSFNNEKHIPYHRIRTKSLTELSNRLFVMHSNIPAINLVLRGEAGYENKAGYVEMKLLCEQTSGVEIFYQRRCSGLSGVQEGNLLKDVLRDMQGGLVASMQKEVSNTKEEEVDKDELTKTLLLNGVESLMEQLLPTEEIKNKMAHPNSRMVVLTELSDLLSPTPPDLPTPILALKGELFCGKDLPGELAVRLIYKAPDKLAITVYEENWTGLSNIPPDKRLERATQEVQKSLIHNVEMDRLPVPKPIKETPEDTKLVENHANTIGSLQKEEESESIPSLVEKEMFGPTADEVVYRFVYDGLARVIQKIIALDHLNGNRPYERIEMENLKELSNYLFRMDDEDDSRTLVLRGESHSERYVDVSLWIYEDSIIPIKIWNWSPIWIYFSSLPLSSIVKRLTEELYRNLTLSLETDYHPSSDEFEDLNAVYEFGVLGCALRQERGAKIPKPKTEKEVDALISALRERWRDISVSEQEREFKEYGVTLDVYSFMNEHHTEDFVNNSLFTMLKKGE